MPSGVATATGFPASGTLRPEKETRSEGVDGDELHAAADEGVLPEAARGDGGPPGLGAVEEAGDDELRRPVGLLLGVEAAGHELEGDAGGRALEDAQRLRLGLAVGLPGGLGRRLRGGRRLLAAAATLATASAAFAAALTRLGTPAGASRRRARERSRSPRRSTSSRR